jgi:hypothetical protein
MLAVFRLPHFGGPDLKKYHPVVEDSIAEAILAYIPDKQVDLVIQDYGSRLGDGVILNISDFSSRSSFKSSGNAIFVR